MPSADVLSHIATFDATSSLASSIPTSSAAPTTLSWSVSGSAQGSGGADTPFTTQLAALLSGVSQQQVGTSERISIGPGLPTIPRKLLDEHLKEETRLGHVIGPLDAQEVEGIQIS